MMTEILMDRPSWEKHFHHLMRNAITFNSLTRMLKRMNKKAIWHFERDYTGCTASIEMESEVIDKRVSFYFMHNHFSRHKKDSGSREMTLTCNVIFDNGESLSEEEALGGLGDFAPKYLKERIKEVHDARVRDDRLYVGGYRNVQVPSGTRQRTK